MKKRNIFLLAILSLIIILFIIRLISSTQIDDIHPEIPCPELEKYNPDILYVIPSYNNILISENPEWCNYILSLNKTIGLHGISHEYREFLYQNITQNQMDSALNEFNSCFNKMPEQFKPPQLEINSKNKVLIKNNNLKLKNKLSTITHKVYHCNDTGIINNKWIKIF